MIPDASMISDPWAEIARLRKAGYGGVSHEIAERQRAEIERLRAEVERQDKQNAAFSDTICERDDTIADLTAALREVEISIAEIKRLREELHYCNGTCDLAIKHRDIAEATIADLTAALDEIAENSTFPAYEAVKQMRARARAALARAQGGR